MNLPIGGSKYEPVNARYTGSIDNSIRDKSGVFLQPDPSFAPTLTTDLLTNPSDIAELVAEWSATSIAPQIFGAENSVNTGSAWFTELDPDDLTTEGVSTRAEGSEYAMVRVRPGELKQLNTDDIGGKFRVSDEAVQAGITDIIADGIALVSSGVRDRLDDLVIAALDKAVERTDHGVMTVDTWTDVQLTGATPTPAGNTPAAALMRAQVIMRREGLMARGDILVMSPEDELALKIAYQENYMPLLENLGIKPVVSPRMPMGSVYLIGSNNLGGIVSRNGLQVETWRDPAIRSTWCQVYLEPACYVARPANVIRIAGTIS